MYVCVFVKLLSDVFDRMDLFGKTQREKCEIWSFYISASLSKLMFLLYSNSQCPREA